MGVSCIVDSITGKMCLVGEQNVTNHMGLIHPVYAHGVNTREELLQRILALQEASTKLQRFVGLQVLWPHESENASKQTEDTSNNLLEC